MIGKNQCEHGSLARSCRICGLEAEIARLEGELANARSARESIEEFSHAKSDMIDKLQAVVDAARPVPWILKHAAGAYIEAGMPEQWQPTMDAADKLIEALRPWTVRHD